MTSNQYVRSICRQLADLGDVRYQSATGKYRIYFNGRIIGYIYNSRFYLKRTDEARALMDRPLELPPYDGAPYCFLIKHLENKEYIASLLNATWNSLAKKAH